MTKKTTIAVLVSSIIAVIGGAGYLIHRTKKSGEKEEKPKSKPIPDTYMDEEIRKLGEKIVKGLSVGPVVGTLYLKRGEVLSNKASVLALSCTGHFYFVEKNKIDVETTNAYFRGSLKELYDMNVPISEIDPDKSEQTVRCGYREKVGPPKPGQVAVKIYE